VLGEQKLIFCVCRDITQRKAAERALQQSEEKYRLVFEKAPLGIMQYDSKSIITDCNEKFAEIIGAPKEQIMGFNMLQRLKDGKMREAVAASFRGEAGYYEGEYLSVTAGKSNPVRALYQPVFSADGVLLGGVSIFEDMSERRQAELARLQYSKLESLSLLAGGIAHDFNNMLLAILGNLSLANMASSFTEIQDRLAAADAAASQAKKLAQQLLTFAKGGMPIKKRQDLKEIILEAVELSLSGSQSRAELSLPDELWEVEVDRGQINQALNNLLLNADQAMPRGGLIRVQAENSTVEPSSSLPLTPGKYLVVTLTDEGIGIPPDHLEKIFDPYFTTKQRGSGLGLATAHSILIKHGGYITVDSRLGQGTAFTLYLPALAGTTPVKGAKEAKLLPGQGRILVLDDDPSVREVLGKMLSRLGYEPVLAAKGEEALELFQRGQTAGEPFAAVILDLTIPGGMGGLETLQHLGVQDPQVKAVVSSGYADNPAMAEFRKYGFQAVIAKPYRLAELGKILQQVLGS